MIHPFLFEQGGERQPIGAGPWWLLANRHQGTAVKRPWVKPPVKQGLSQCGWGFPFAERYRPSSCGLAVWIHQYTCQAASPRLYAQLLICIFPVTVKSRVNSLLESLSIHHPSVRSAMMVTVFWRSLC